jgi:hypothetical protein
MKCLKFQNALKCLKLWYSIYLNEQARNQPRRIE